MSILVDNLVAYRVLSMLVKNFEDTKAFKLGIIDAKGKNLKKPATLKTQEEKEAYNYLNRLVFNMKKIINRLPGGESKLKSLTAAYFLVKEYYERNDRTTSLMEEKYVKLMEHLNINLYLVEEELFIKQWIEENQITELTTDLLARYKTAASASAKASDEAGNYKKGDKRFSGINKATRKQFDNDLKKHGQYVKEGRGMADKYYALAQDRKATADENKDNHETYHTHMADHHDHMSRYHEELGQNSLAQSHADKADIHHEKSMERPKRQYKESDASWAAAMEKQKENRLTTNDKKKLDQVRALLAKEKKPVKEEMAANCTGAAVATDTPAPLKKDIKKYKNIARRKPLVPGV